MKQEFRLLYNKMLQDIRQTMEMEVEERQKTDTCFWIAKSCWDKLKEIIKQRDFTENEEIDFFRNVKPRFTCYIEYMMLLSEGTLFVPTEKRQAINYWTEQINRFKVFYKKNIEFIVYYERKDWHNNPIYFLRKNNKSDNSQSAHLYDADPQYCTSHDPIIRSYLAYKMYSKYARKRLWELTGRIQTNNGTKDSVTFMMDKNLEVSRRRKVI